MIKIFKQLTTVATFVPATWIIEKNYLFDPCSIDFNNFNKNEQFLIEHEILCPSYVIFSIKLI